MRYGPNLHELDPAVRRKSTQSLKKAAPGAPFGWTSDGKPYIGTQYAVRGTQFCSISTRSGAPSYYWKPLSTVSLKVALSAIETHGSVDNLFGGETFTPCSEILSASELANVRATFTRLIGADELRRLESAGDVKPQPNAVKPEPSAEAQPPQPTGAAEVKPKLEPTDAAEAGPPAGAPSSVPEASSEEPSKVLGAKRKARMALVDEMRGGGATSAAEAKPAKSKRKSKPTVVD